VLIWGTIISTGLKRASLAMVRAYVRESVTWHKISVGSSKRMQAKPTSPLAAPRPSRTATKQFRSTGCNVTDVMVLSCVMLLVGLEGVRQPPSATEEAARRDLDPVVEGGARFGYRVTVMGDIVGDGDGCIGAAGSAKSSDQWSGATPEGPLIVDRPIFEACFAGQAGGKAKSLGLEDGSLLVQGDAG